MQDWRALISWGLGGLHMSTEGRAGEKCVCFNCQAGQHGRKHWLATQDRLASVLLFNQHGRTGQSPRRCFPHLGRENRYLKAGP